MARRRHTKDPTEPEAGPSHCNDCGVNAECWKAHRARVRSIVPELCAYVDSWPERGQDYMLRAQREFSQGDKVIEPYTSVMMGNMEDGARVYAGEGPKDRKDSTLTWPLTPVPPVES